MIPRWYQKKSAKKIRKALAPGVHPVVVLPTATGKSLVLCMITEDFLDENIEKDVLVLSHVSDILSQDLETLTKYFPGVNIGLYSAGLGEKEKRKITVAGIQSVWRNPELFDNVGIVIIDEAHLVNIKEVGMYREFLGHLDANYIGLTATPFRLGQGYIYKGENALFNHLAYDLSSTENYDRLVKEGYLSDMFSFRTIMNMKTEGIRKHAGDFANNALSKKFDKEEITRRACAEVVAGMEELNLKKALVFSINIQHAEHIKTEFEGLGVSVAIVHSKTKGNKITKRKFARGDYQIMVNVDMLTTGLDVPDIDLIVLLRSTLSASLHVQMLGRGGRPFYAKGYNLENQGERLEAIKTGGKPYCIVMDFAGNLERLGPINNVHIKEPGEKKEGGEFPMKECPLCKTRNYGAVKFCIKCGFEFEFETNLDLNLKDSEVISRNKKKVQPITKDGTWLRVDLTKYKMHLRRGQTPSMKVSYQCGDREFYEYVCINHKGMAWMKAETWIKMRIPKGIKFPMNLHDLDKVISNLNTPRKILVAKRGGFNEIIGHRLKK